VAEEQVHEELKAVAVVLEERLQAQLLPLEQVDVVEMVGLGETLMVRLRVKLSVSVPEAV
jgi:hypothetical protein